jgi:hypothetical protein
VIHDELSKDHLAVWRGIAISHAREVILKGNVFENVATPYALKSGDQTKVIKK